MRTTKIAALFAAVALLVVGATFATFAAEPKWVAEGEDWTYYDKNGDQVYDAWKQSGDGWYYLNEDGIMAKSTLIENDTKTYYVDETGRMVTSAWVKVVDDDYADLLEDDVNYRWFYFGSDGKAYKNAKKDCPTSAGTFNFIFNSDGFMVYGWAKETKDFAEDYQDGEYYCGDANDGAVVKGDWRKLVIDEDEDESAWFYFKATTGAKYTGENKKIGGKTYSFDENGVMLTEWTTDSTISKTDATNSYFDEDGAKVVKGWFFTWEPNYDGDDDEDDKAWYYAKNKNEVAVDTVVSDGGKFYFVQEDGKLVSGLVKVTWSLDVNGKLDKVTDVENIDAFADIAAPIVSPEFLYYCNEEHDGTFGCVLTGTRSIEDGDYTLSFAAASTMKKGNGQAYQEANGNSWYVNGEKVTGDADENKYYFVKVDTSAATEATLKKSKFADTKIVVTDTTAVEPFAWTSTDGDYAVMSASGSFYKTLTNRKESNGDYKVTVKNWTITAVTPVE